MSSEKLLKQWQQQVIQENNCQYKLINYNFLVAALPGTEDLDPTLCSVSLSCYTSFFVEKYSPIFLLENTHW